MNQLKKAAEDASCKKCKSYFAKYTIEAAKKVLDEANDTWDNYADELPRN